MSTASNIGPIYEKIENASSKEERRALIGKLLLDLIHNMIYYINRLNDPRLLNYLIRHIHLSGSRGLFIN